MTATRKRKKPLLAEDEKVRRRAARKAEFINAKLRDDAGPLFASQIPREEFTDAVREYWRSRRNWAIAPHGPSAAYLSGIDWKVDLLILHNLARRVMSAADYAIAASKERQHGDTHRYWRNILLGQQRIVLDYERRSRGWNPCFRDLVALACCEHGCWKCESKLIAYIEKTEMRESLVWPPEGWTPPLTPEQFDTLTAIPPANDFAPAIDPLGLIEDAKV
jgi:hypothetical protein